MARSETELGEQRPDLEFSMLNTQIHRYFKSRDTIFTTEIIGPLRAAKNDCEIKEIVERMNAEAREKLGPRFYIRFDKSSMSRDAASRVFISRRFW
jgi:hypothetical protein